MNHARLVLTSNMLIKLEERAVEPLSAPRVSLVSSSGAVTETAAEDVLPAGQLDCVSSTPQPVTAPVDIGATSSQTALFYHPDVVKHPGSYCEVPLRCKVVFERLVQFGIAQRCVFVGGRPLASVDVLGLAHLTPLRATGGSVRSPRDGRARRADRTSL